MNIPRTGQALMTLSVGAAFLQLFIKIVAAIFTGSAAVFADAAESGIHLIAVIFAFFSLRISHLPPDRDHPYGHAKIGFFSAGVEGAVILFAAVFILVDAIRRMVTGPELQQVGLGIVLTAVTILINTGLGWMLLRHGKKSGQLILIANGKHVLTDAWTSLGVIAGLTLAWWTGWSYWDPICAIFVAINIVVTGASLVRRGFSGLMDTASEKDLKTAEQILADSLKGTGVSYHALRLRNLGNAVAIDLHLLFEDQLSVREAHAFATRLEEKLSTAYQPNAVVMTHLEPRSDHARIHSEGSDGT